MHRASATFTASIKLTLDNIEDSFVCKLFRIVALETIRQHRSSDGIVLTMSSGAPARRKHLSAMRAVASSLFSSTVSSSSKPYHLGTVRLAMAFICPLREEASFFIY